MSKQVKSIKLYMKTTTDRFELPIAVADSTHELAEMLHMSNGSVASAISRGVCGYYKVIIPEPWGNDKGEANERAIST